MSLALRTLTWVSRGGPYIDRHLDLELDNAGGRSLGRYWKELRKPSLSFICSLRQFRGNNGGGTMLTFSRRRPSHCCRDTPCSARSSTNID